MYFPPQCSTFSLKKRCKHFRFTYLCWTLDKDVCFVPGAWGETTKLLTRKQWKCSICTYVTFGEYLPEGFCAFRIKPTCSVWGIATCFLFHLLSEKNRFQCLLLEGWRAQSWEQVAGLWFRDEWSFRELNLFGLHNWTWISLITEFYFGNL